MKGNEVTSSNDRNELSHKPFTSVQIKGLYEVT